MAYGFAFVVIAFGGSLLYKGYKGYSWPEFYAAVFSGAKPAKTASAAAGVKTIVHATGP